MISWILQPSNAALVAWTSVLLGAAGVIFTVVSLAIALRQLKAIKTETQATSEAVEAVQFKIENFDAAKECQIAEGLISRIRIAYRKGDWDEMLETYEHLIQSFIRLRHSGSKHVVSNVHKLSQASFDMTKICEGIRRRLESAEEEKTMRGQDRALREFGDIIAQIHFAASKDLQK